MDVSRDTQVTLMLTSRLSANEALEESLLTPGQWNVFASWLARNDSKPSDLLTSAVDDILQECPSEIGGHSRLKSLLNRGMALGMALEQWERAGIWAISCADSETYPNRLRSKLGKQAPSVLIGCGHIQLANNPGIAVVGSRNAPMEDLEAARAYGNQIAHAGCNVVSGGARGVDEQAQFGSFDAGGTAIAFLSHGLRRISSKAAFREQILAGNLLLLSATHPDAGFHPGTAMQRNKYIYGQSDAAIVVHSGSEGGTWNGAVENLEQEWVPLWVHPTKDEDAANNLLLSRGAHRLDQDIESIDFGNLSTVQTSMTENRPTQTDMFSIIMDDADTSPGAG